MEDECICGDPALGGVELHDGPEASEGQLINIHERASNGAGAITSGCHAVASLRLRPSLFFFYDDHDVALCPYPSSSTRTPMRRSVVCDMSAEPTRTAETDQ